MKLVTNLKDKRSINKNSPCPTTANKTYHSVLSRNEATKNRIKSDHAKKNTRTVKATQRLIG